ncbi:MAG: TerB family tellurite resistance protein [Deltaproteobacteria bacterium]|nr:TerB family tellurite resistance protein [Deltaproteobacteria bacterium]MCB9787537.1 TerB family tellurite resistance protein [Deltaproteobacteria bacterium]
MKLDGMDERTRINLLKMACVAAWSDLSIAEAERKVVLDLASEISVGPEGKALAEAWLRSPPGDFDPYDIPHRHAKTFIEALQTVMRADGRIDPEESETLRLIRELVA